MVKQGDTVQVSIDIAKDGSGHSLYGSHKGVEAIVAKTPEQTHWGKYLLIIPMSSLVDHLRMTDTEIEEKLQLSTVNGYSGYKVSANEGYVTE